MSNLTLYNVKNDNGILDLIAHAKGEVRMVREDGSVESVKAGSQGFEALNQALERGVARLRLRLDSRSDAMRMLDYVMRA